MPKRIRDVYELSPTVKKILDNYRIKLRVYDSLLCFLNLVVIVMAIIDVSISHYKLPFNIIFLVYKHL